uniref:Uncharacterized protein n=1 Tax=Nelumbo nucifera TaxID=4432 RepID=A0A822XSP9_NELNU|nr:TPA_asm: hypothetical protein HUJ06_024893 [Nelumbo nucifera]
MANLISLPLQERIPRNNILQRATDIIIFFLSSSSSPIVPNAPTMESLGSLPSSASHGSLSAGSSPSIQLESCEYRTILSASYKGLAGLLGGHVCDNSRPITRTAYHHCKHCVSLLAVDYPAHKFLLCVPTMRFSSHLLFSCRSLQVCQTLGSFRDWGNKEIFRMGCRISFTCPERSGRAPHHSSRSHDSWLVGSTGRQLKLLTVLRSIQRLNGLCRPTPAFLRYTLGVSPRYDPTKEMGHRPSRISLELTSHSGYKGSFDRQCLGI